MYPNDDTQPIQTKSSPLNKRIALLFVVIIICLGVLFSLYEMWLTRQFRVISTNPTTSKIATVAPFFKVGFNKQLSTQGVLVTSNPSIINSFSVNGSMLNIVLNEPMKLGQTYTITIKNIVDVSGQHLNKSFSFVPQYVLFQNLPQDEQQALIQPQTQSPSNTFIGFSGLDTLLGYGVTTEQETDLTQAFTKFDSTAQTVSIDTNSIVAVPHDPNSSSTTNVINFTVTVDKNTYTATIDYSNITELELYLYNNQTNALVYDSKPINFSTQ